MPMKVEAAIVTQKRPEAVYNTDSVNVNGKVMPREVIKNGYKGSGVLSGSVYFAITSSDVEGFADASVMAFNERAELFARSREPMSVFSGFFEDCRGALLNMERSENDLVCAGFYARGRKAVIARNGATKIYLQRLGVTAPVTTEKVADTTADFSGAVFSDVCEGDIFILLSPGAAEALGDKEIEDILRISDGSVKRVVNYILKVALAADSDKAVSAVVVKVLETAPEEEITGSVFVPDYGEEKEEALENTEESEEATAENTEEAEAYAKEAEPDAEEADSAEEADESAEEVVSPAETEKSAQAASDETDDISAVFARNALEMFENAEVLDEASDKNEEVLYTEELETAAEFEEAETAEAVTVEKNDGKKSRTPLFVILGIMLAVSVSLIIAFFVVPAFSGNGEETTVEETTTEEESTDEETTDEETTVDESAEEETTEEITTAEETTTRSAPAENTTSAPVTEATTAAPVVAPEQTTAAQEETEATTESEEATTSAEEVTTVAPETEPAEVTTEAPATDAPAEASEEASSEPETVQ